MNIENLKQLKDWLMAGAPHVILNMNVGILDIDDVHTISLDAEKENFLQNQVASKSDCGTICCIAGAAHMMSHAEDGEIFPSITKQNDILLTKGTWGATRDAALSWLGLERQYFTPSEDVFLAGHFGHKLFENDLAPANCTPHQAAQAVQNVIDGKEPWEGIS